MGSEGRAPGGAAGRPRILFIRLSAVGDVINTLPALEAVRSALPGAFIGFAVEDRAHDLLAGHPSVDRVHLFARRRWARMAHHPLQWSRALGEVTAYLSEIRRERYEVALDFQSNLKGGLHSLLSGARRRIGFGPGHCSEGDHLFNNIHVTPRTGCLNRVEKFLSLAAALGISTRGARYRLPEPESSRSLVRAFLEREGLNRYAALHPGTSEFGRAKRWRPERFAALAARMSVELGLRAVVTWGPGERPLAEEVVRGAGGAALLSPETKSVLDLAEVLRRAYLFVGCDSGPLHLASAVGTPSVALFGPKDPRIYGPYSPRHRIVFKAEANGGNGSMDAITVEDAFRAVVDLLRQINGPTGF